MTILFMNKS